YHTAHGHLPPGVSTKVEPDAFPLMGWQARVLPYVEQESIWRQVVEAIKTQPNDFTANPPHPFATVVSAFGCPADDRLRTPALARGKLTVALGSYLGV